LWDKGCGPFWAPPRKSREPKRKVRSGLKRIQWKAQMRLLVVGLLLSWSPTLAQVRAVVPAQTSAQANRVYSPAVDAGDYVYVSGQGPRRPDGSLAPTFSAQARQALDNVKAIVESAGLTMEHVVYTQVYLEDISKYGEMDGVFAEYFGKAPPARAVLGVAKIPEPPIQINAVAVRSLADKRAVYPPNYKSDESAAPGILTHDRLFVSGMLGSDPASGRVPDDPAAQVDLALDRAQAVLKAAGLELSNMVFVNPYLTAEIPMRVMNERYARRFEFGNTPARATIEVSSLPGGVRIEYTGVAVRDLQQRRAVRPKNMPPSPTASPCVFAGDTLYCSAKSGFIPGPHGGVYASTTPHQLRQTMRNLLDNLEEASMSFDEVVATNVYFDDMQDMAAFDEVYAQYFRSVLPSRTAIQQIAPTGRKFDKEDHYPDLEQVSLIAVRGRSGH
jgi:2-iminobutanoate/2-iminopropanoate deaminase